MIETKSHEWLAAYGERVGEIPGLPPDEFGRRLLESRDGSESAYHALVSVSLAIALEVARDIWESGERTRAVWDVVGEANSAIFTAIRSFFGVDWQEFQSHVRTTVRMRIRE